MLFAALALPEHALSVTVAAKRGGGAEYPLIRSRLVARDFKTKGDNNSSDLFAAMPPLEALRTNISDAVTRNHEHTIMVLLRASPARHTRRAARRGHDLRGRNKCAKQALSLMGAQLFSLTYADWRGWGGPGACAPSAGRGCLFGSRASMLVIGPENRYVTNTCCCVVN